jgi:hypothetical protein
MDAGNAAGIYVRPASGGQSIAELEREVAKTDGIYDEAMIGLSAGREPCTIGFEVALVRRSCFSAWKRWV